MSEAYKISLNTASFEATKLDIIRWRDYDGLPSLSDRAGAERLLVEVNAWMLFDVHNEHATDRQDYQVLVVQDEDGQRYVTSSNAAIESVTEIWSDLVVDGYNSISYVFYTKQSKNDKTRRYLAATIAD